MADSRKHLSPRLRALVDDSEANGHCVHVYSVRPKAHDKRRIPVLMFAIDGAPRSAMTASILDRLEAMAGHKL